MLFLWLYKIEAFSLFLLLQEGYHFISIKTRKSKQTAIQFRAIKLFLSDSNGASKMYDLQAFTSSWGQEQRWPLYKGCI